ncbi:MAG: hypothetical protein A3I66_13380 [Burkholderiales bacterium RIFCSPLOWO2_02_FULL_57_36]|nr:MAG: hypothetical protein A3I66_13380 [Burkholderiales bacterium RIFCSPLOWO2_02_FULL_57_36]
MHKLSRSLDVRIEWSLAVVLQTMTAAALNGLTTRRTQAVAEHLHIVAQSQSTSPELRAACANLSESWRVIDLQ